MKYSRSNSTRLVYSTNKTEDICPQCGEQRFLCNCQKESSLKIMNDIVRVRREVKGRRGKTVTAVQGIPLADQDIKTLASELKRFCGTGGSVKEGVVIIQGDHREKIITWLKNRGYQAKQAGG